jgi:mRNA interferase HigB
MRIITERRIREFWAKNKLSESAFRDWVQVVRHADWQSFPDVRNSFNHVDFHNKLTIFDVGGNKFRIITKIEYPKHLVFIKFVLTHAEYDEHSKWCGCGQK